MAHLRTPRRLIAFGTLVVAAGGLVALEHTAGGAAPGAPGKPAVVTTTTQAAALPAAKPDPGTPPPHCGDGTGADNPQNKHCRLASG